ncbi:type II secretion system F family protein [Bacillus cihuensis]|uniref:type II secretion system F family protein n=1 Tax=Bacillus cihuensis TaxID=1208599 RepID=UPI000425197D|nr:type II secretion system F family protein [Bacillus cihuensis]
MPVFHYQGRDRAGRKKQGKVTADTRKEAVEGLRETGIAVTSIDELKGILYKEISLGSKKVKNRDFIMYLHQFSTLIKAGISVVESTKILAEQTSSKLLRKTLENIVLSLEEGNPYSEGAEKQRNVFPPLFINMMRAGEAGGNLEEVLERMAIYFEKQYQTRQKVQSALMYPVTVGCLSIVIIIFMLAKVVPTFANMFLSFGSELPFFTKLVLNLSGFFERFWWVFLLVAVSLYILIRSLKSKNDTKYYLDYGLLRLPIFGQLLQKAEIARMTRTLSSLIKSSVPILQSLTMVEKILGNEVLIRVMKQSRHSIEKGESMAIPMEKHWAFPPMVTQMIAVGEKSGTLDVMLDRVADFYEMEVDHATNQMKSLIEPFLIIFLAVVVGGIVAAIAIPMFTIFNKIQ